VHQGSFRFLVPGPGALARLPGHFFMVAVSVPRFGDVVSIARRMNG
jgi:hypothetical protein